ncbi:MAG: hypothetical protein V1809_05420 [Planctomycetota bacterium]
MRTPGPPNPSLTGRLAIPADDCAIRAFLRRQTMPGPVEISFTYEPDYFRALEVQGEHPRVLLGESEGRILAIGVMAGRSVYLNGRPECVGYLSSLRLDETIRHSTALARGYRLLRRIHDVNHPNIFYLTTILEKNMAARRTITSGRAGLPVYQELGRYRTLLYPAFRRRAARVPKNVTMVRGNAVGAKALAEFLNRTGSRRQFYPVYTRELIEKSDGLLRGLFPEDFLVAQQDGRVKGILALWNQFSFRQYVITRIPPHLRPLTITTNTIGRLAGWTGWPVTGQPLNIVLAACVAVEDDDLPTFALLLRAALCETRRRGIPFLACGLTEDDPLLPAATMPIHLTLRSRIYAVYWRDPPETLHTLDRRPMHLELGSL